MGAIFFITLSIFLMGFASGFMFTDQSTKQERQKWCQHYHSEFKKVEGCVKKPDWEVGK